MHLQHQNNVKSMYLVRTLELNVSNQHDVIANIKTILKLFNDNNNNNNK